MGAISRRGGAGVSGPAIDLTVTERPPQAAGPGAHVTVPAAAAGLADNRGGPKGGAESALEQQVEAAVSQATKTMGVDYAVLPDELKEALIKAKVDFELAGFEQTMKWQEAIEKGQLAEENKEKARASTTAA